MSGHVCCFATEFDKERDTCIPNALSTSFFFVDEVTVLYNSVYENKSCEAVLGGNII